MTFTIETTPERELILEQEAKRRGLSMEQFARSLFEEAIEDLEDAITADRIAADPTQ